VDEIETAQAVSAWRALRWRTVVTVPESGAVTIAYSAGCAG